MEKQLEKEIIKILNSGKLSREDLIKKLKIKGRTARNLFDEIVDKIEAEGKIFIDEKNCFHIFDGSVNYIQGRIFINIDGTGYFTGKKNGKQVKFVIPHKDLNGALSGDIVVVKDKNKINYDRKLGSILKVVKRSERSEIFHYLGNGLFKLYNGISDTFFYKREKECRDLVEGSLVLAKIDRTPIVGSIFAGENEKIVGHVDDPKAIIRAVGIKYGFNHEFSDNVMEEARMLPNHVLDEDLEGRRDLRDEVIFTIDGDDTKDIDDAVSIEKDGDEYILKVHIADVSYYLKDKSKLTKEALSRGNSAYLVDSVFPMLPHLISNGICSLNPGEDRLTKTVEMRIDKEGNVVASEIYKSVIHSRKKMAYDKVNKVLNGESVADYDVFKDSLFMMNKLSKILAKKRIQDGAIDFYSNELKIATNIYGNAISVKPREMGDAEKLIESFMIAANTEVTTHYGFIGLPFVYRVHPQPNVKKLLTALKELKVHGIENADMNLLMQDLEKQLSGRKMIISPSRIGEFLRQIQGEDYYEAVSNMILRCMEKAYYSDENIGHFGLANNSYSHFTSPIRRSADLINHFIIDLMMEYYTVPDKSRCHEIERELINIKKKLPDLCAHISQTEWLADEAEKEIDKIKMAEYFNDHLEEYEGPIMSRINYINKLGIYANVDVFDVFIPKDELNKLGYAYKRNSRTFVRKKKEKMNIGDEVYLFYPEVSLGNSTIIYNEIAKDPDELLAPPHPKRLIKSIKIKTN